MELTNEFRVGVAPATAWAVLTDVERIAPCMPGAQLQEIEGDEYRGVVKVKVGPITAQYKGKATFLELDEANRRAVLRAEGRDTRGQGNANATITAALHPDGDGTRVTVTTDLTVTGKVAQFGRGVMADVSAKLLTQFVECLEATVLSGDNEQHDQTVGVVEGSAVAEPPQPAPPAVPTTGPASPGAGVRTVDSPEAKPVDLLDTAGAPVAKRVAPVLAILAVAWLVRVLVRRRRA
jgi:carbon monoxide dehydrogenase subunit G